MKKNDIISAKDWNTLSKGIVDLAKTKKTRVFHTSECADKKQEFLEDEIVKKNDRIKSEQVKDILEAIGQLEASFSSNCCQRQCHCQRDCSWSCQTTRTGTQHKSVTKRYECWYHYAVVRGCQTQPMADVSINCRLKEKFQYEYGKEYFNVCQKWKQCQNCLVRGAIIKECSITDCASRAREHAYSHITGRYPPIPSGCQIVDKTPANQRWQPAVRIVFV